MFGPAEFRDLVSGRRHGIRAMAVRGLLRAGEMPYTTAVAWRNRRYDQGRATVQHVSVPVISVGNLTLGGTGKTPMVKWLARWLAKRNVRAAIVSRGYGAEAGCENDEARELHQSLPDIPHVQNPDRVAAARQAIQEFHAQLILLDDGFQHRRLARQLDIVLLDALEPFGFGHVFPRGTLREPLVGLRRAHIVGLSRSDIITPGERESLRSRVVELAPHAVWCELVHAPNGLLNSAGVCRPLDMLAGCRVAAFCGIGNPAGFRHTLAEAGCQIVAWNAFADHHAFDPADLAGMRRMAVDSRADILVCTQKDLVKIGRAEIDGVPLWALTVEMRFLSGQESCEQMIETAVLSSGGSPSLSGRGPG